MKLRRVALVWSLSMIFAIAANAESREHVVCYQAKPAKKACSTASTNAGEICSDDADCTGGVCEKQTKFPKGLFAKLDDAFDPSSVGEDKTFEIKKLKELCVPVDKNDEGIDDPNTFWVSYQLKQAKRTCNAGGNLDQPCKDVDDCPGGACVDIPKFDKKAARNINLFVEDQFTNVRLDAGKVDRLLVPASLCDGDDDATCVDNANAQPAAGTEEHYKCYKAKSTKKVCAPGTANDLQVCKKDEDCGGIEDACVKLDKVAKGLNATATDLIPGVNTDRTFDIAKLTHVCTAVEKTPLTPVGAPEGPVSSASRLLCYKSKASKGQCNGGTNAGGSCKKDDQCPGAACQAQAKYDKKNPLGLGLYVNDQFDLVSSSTATQPGDYHRLNLSKEAMFCLPACENPDALMTATDDVVRAITLSIPSTGNPGDGQDVDGNPGTCQPAGCSGGIDNVLGILSGFITDLNTTLQNAVTNGDINIILELDEFAAGAQLANGFTGELASPSGCTDINDGGQVCNYEVESGINTASCTKESLVAFPIDITGLPGSPATVAGGGIGSDLKLALPFAGAPLNLNVRNVKVGAQVVHTAGAISTASGALGGALNQRELKSTILALPDGLCAGGINQEEACSVDADCPGSTCNTSYLGGFDKNTVASLFELLLLRDIDLDGLKTCEGGNNNGEFCTVDADCPDQFPPSSPVCDQNDAHSIGIKFTAIDAAISNISLACDKATCSLY